MTRTNRTDERAQYLADVLTTAIEHSGYGFPGVIEYVWDVPDPRDTYAVIYDRYELEDSVWTTPPPEKTWRIDIDTIAKGFGIVREKYKGEDYARWVTDLKLSDRTNGDDGDYDVIGALLVLECALFGEGTYS